MASVAQSAVLVSSVAAAEVVAALPAVHGPGEAVYSRPGPSLEVILGSYPTLGFQATHMGKARAVLQMMLERQSPSTIYKIEAEKMVEVAPEATGAHGTEDPDALVYPTIFMGITANLLGTGCREALRFLVQEGVAPRSPPEEGQPAVDSTRCTSSISFPHLKATEKAADSLQPSLTHRSFLSAIVVSGGGMEHDIRRACATYTVCDYASEAGAHTASDEGPISTSDRRFGNVTYPLENSLFNMVMQLLVNRLVARQGRLKVASASRPTPKASYEDVCHWATTPSEVWALTGIWLGELLTEALTVLQLCPGKEAEEAERRSQSTVLHWAAKEEVPIFSPSFSDGDIMSYLLPFPSSSPTSAELPRLQIDLVRDIHGVNKLAMLSKRTGMIICGGGVVKHHVCNANLMRNGADYTVLISNGQEFDGSDAGARLDEAVSWGKVRWDGASVKIYAEVSMVLPLLITQVFVPAVRARRAKQTP